MSTIPEGWDDSLNTDAEAVASGVEAALAATASAQAQSAAFMVAHGAEVVPGHPDTVGAAGNPPDNDLSGPDASDV